MGERAEMLTDSGTVSSSASTAAAVSSADDEMSNADDSMLLHQLELAINHPDFPLDELDQLLHTSCNESLQDAMTAAIAQPIRGHRQQTQTAAIVQPIRGHRHQTETVSHERQQTFSNEQAASSQHCQHHVTGNITMPLMFNASFHQHGASYRPSSRLQLDLSSDQASTTTRQLLPRDMASNVECFWPEDMEQRQQLNRQRPQSITPDSEITKSVLRLVISR